ncbi:MAG: gluconate 2-dehydrogenase subunit 3 family protein [Gemmatimonadaceae bacterium]|nr:gluconate 2-dehydrogenase subunit 3 family protein [Gemmatimonadaceae bacterium]
MTHMNRRDAVKAAGLLLGGAALASTGLLSACSKESRTTATSPGAMALSADDEALMGVVADTILPDTPSSPGAKAAGAGPAINLLLTDVYDATARARIGAGLLALRQRSASFASLPPADRETMLRTIDVEAKAEGPSHWFHLMHELSMKAYFASEIGQTKALRYIQEPHRFTGCVPLTPGQPAWA